MQWLVLVLLLSACGSSSTAGLESDAAPVVECIPFSGTECSGGNLYWVDSCGERGDLREECLVGRTCIESRDACCRLPTTMGTYTAPTSPVRISWTTTEATSLIYRGEILRATTGANDVGQGFLHQGRIGDLTFSFGLRTTISTPQGRVGAGVLLQLEGVSDAGRGIAADGGFVEADSIFGVDYTKVGLALPWSVGPFELELVSQQMGENWFTAYFQQGETIPRQSIGQLRFNADRISQVDASIHTQIHYPFADIGHAVTPPLEVSFEFQQGDQPATSASVEFDDSGTFPNVDVSYFPGTGRVLITQGMGTGRCGDDRTLY